MQHPVLPESGNFVSSSQCPRGVLSQATHTRENKKKKDGPVGAAILFGHRGRTRTQSEKKEKKKEAKRKTGQEGRFHPSIPDQRKEEAQERDAQYWRRSRRRRRGIRPLAPPLRQLPSRERRINTTHCTHPHGHHRISGTALLLLCPVPFPAYAQR